MSGIFNLIVAALVLLIAYWWANQGVFSSILHFVCVACAGAMALALWEPVTVNYLLTGGGFDDYAWGMSLGGMFVVFLLLFRLAADKLAPSNLEFPQWANYAVGGAFGLLSGMLTLGITIISAGFIQSTTELGGFIGFARDQGAGGAPARIQSMWLPVASFTEGFYSTLSKGALSPMRQTALALYYPRLADMALSAHRDSYGDGAGKTSISPKSIQLSQLALDPSYRNGDGSQGAYALDVTVDASGFDGGEQFTLSSAQVRLIGGGPKAHTAHPTQWVQPNEAGEPTLYAFDDLTNYASSVPGRQSVDLTLVFPVSALSGETPRFVQVKGLRMALPEIKQVQAALVGGAGSGGGSAAQASSAVQSSGAPMVPDLVERKNSIMPAQLSTNQVSGLEILENNQGNWISGGRAEFPKGGAGSISRANRIRGFYADKGTQIVMLDISRGQGLPVNVYDGPLAADKGASLTLVDSQGNTYRPCGYVWEKRDKVELFYDTKQLLGSLDQLPKLPSSGDHILKLVFKVPEASTIVGVMVGDTVVARTNVLAIESQSDG